MSRSRIALATLALALLAGCASSDADSEPSPEVTQSPVVDVEPTPTAPLEEAAVEQWSGIAAEQRRAVDEVLSDWDDATCSTGAVAAGAVDCLAILVQADYVARAAEVTFRGSADEESPGYIGDPPDEVSGLVRLTTTAALSAVMAAEDYRDADCPDGDGCRRAALDLVQAMGRLQSTFDRWEPYL